MRGTHVKHHPEKFLPAPGGKALKFASTILLRVQQDGNTFILRDSGNGLPNPHTDVCFDLSVEENIRMQLGEPRVCRLPARQEKAAAIGLPCSSLVRWLPIENGTGAISCPWHGEIPFSNTELSQTVPPEGE
jgi:hypothetical protein